MKECMYRNCNEHVGYESRKGRKKLYCCGNHQQMEGYHRNKDCETSLETKIKLIVETMLKERFAR